MPGKNLTRTEAESRSAIVCNPHYEVTLDLTKGPRTFLSTSHVTFEAQDGASTWIDLIAPKAMRITLNGTDIDPESAFNDCRIALNNLQKQNDLTVVAECEYSHTGEGLHRAVDTADGLVYLYTQFEVMDARRVYAAFDQPDIKGTFNFTVLAPKSWTVTSTMLPTEKNELEGVKTDPATLSNGVIDNVVEWVFPTTPRMSSYLTSLVAGPYAEWHTEYKNADGRILPMGLYCRQSIKDGLDKDADYLFEEVQKGFDFYNKTFGVIYPYQKYDQIFVPEYNAGAMENIGNVTVVDSYVFQSKVSDAVADRRVSSLLHELAHMWFGDLVTMKWWNDLWLNESFAEFMCTLCTAEATEWTTEWSTFASGEKSWGEEQDQLPTTHPVVAPINDINDTEANFDGITYAKGGSVLHQLMAYVGRENFFKGIHNYLVKHSYGNATLNDLLAELNAASGRDLDAWSKLWLQESGINTLTTVVDTDENGIITKFVIKQKGSADNNVLRPHTLKIGFYGLDPETGKVTRQSSYTEDVAAAEETEITDLIGKKRPEFIMLNDDDLTYAKLRFDRDSLNFLADHLADFDDALARAITSLALWDMTRDAEFPAAEYIKIALAQLASEDQATTFKTVLKALLTTVRQYVAPAQAKDMSRYTSSELWKLVQEAEAGSDAQFQLLGAYLSLGSDEDFEEHAHDLLNGSLILPGIDVDNNLRWQIIIALARAGEMTDDEIQAELDKDDSIANREFAYNARASRPTHEAKEWAWNEAMNNLTLTNSQLRAVVLGYASGTDADLYNEFVERFFDAINTVWTTRTFHSSETMLGSCVSDYSLYPAPADATQLIAVGEKWVKENSDADRALMGTIQDNLAATRRMQKAQAYNAAL